MVARWPSNIEYRKALADVLLRWGKPEAALFEFSILTEKDTTCIECWLYIGKIHSDMGDQTAAFSAYQRAWDLEPASTRMKREMFGFLKGVDDKYVVINWYKNVSVEFPDDASYPNNIGFNYILLKKYENAIEYCEKSIRIDREFANPHAHLGFARLKLGYAHEPKKELNKAKGLNKYYNKTYFYLACYYSNMIDLEIPTKDDLKELALDALEEAVYRKFEYKKWIMEEPLLDSIKGTKRFQEILLRIPDE